MTAPYVRYLADWKNKPDFSTPITAEAIEHIETGIINAPTVPINIDDTGIAAFLKTTSLTQHTATLWQAAIAGSGVALNVVSDNPDASAMYLSGIDSGTGTLKITHRKPGVADANASALSIDLQDGVGFGGSAAQGIFLTATEGATTGNLLCLRNNSRDDFVVKGTGRVGIGLAIGATPAGELEIHQTDVANIGLAITALASGTHMLMLKDSGGNPRFEVGNSGSMVARAVAFFTSSLQVGASSADLGGGAGVISIKDATTVPTTNPTGGGILYMQANQLKLRDSAGTVTPLTGGAITTTEQILQIDSFAGATDRDKFTAAMTFMAAETRKRAMQFPRRTFGSSGTPLLNGNQIFSGLRLYGPHGNDGPKNIEVGSGNYVDHKVHVSSGTGTSSFLVGNAGTIYDFEIRNIAFEASGGGQLIENTTGTFYVPNFHAFTMFGFTYGIGRPAGKCLMTQPVFSGHCQAVGFTDTQLTLGGSDMNLYMSGYFNAGSNTAGAGKPIVILDFVNKTDVGYLYLTTSNDWIGLQVKGSAGYNCKFFGGQYEGTQAAVATRPVIDLQGGHNIFYSPWTAYVDDVANAPGVVRQSGGYAKFYSPTYDRYSACADTHPWLYQTAGIAHVHKPHVVVGVEQMRLRWSSGTTDPVPLPANGYTA